MVTAAPDTDCFPMYCKTATTRHRVQADDDDEFPPQGWFCIKLFIRNMLWPTVAGAVNVKRHERERNERKSNNQHKGNTCDQLRRNFASVGLLQASTKHDLLPLPNVPMCPLSDLLPLPNVSKCPQSMISCHCPVCPGVHKA